MTQEEFRKTIFSAKDKVEYQGIEYPLGSVDFEECLIGLLIGEDHISWVRCENALHKPYKFN